MFRSIHLIAGVSAILLITTFWLATALSELSGTFSTIVAVKTAIPWGFLLPVPPLAAAAGSGIVLAWGRRVGLVGAKGKRMPLIAANGPLVLIPYAYFLAAKAGAGKLASSFCRVQALELVAGATNIMLLGPNLRDGLRMKGRPRRQPAWSRKPPRSGIILCRFPPDKGHG